MSYADTAAVGCAFQRVVRGRSDALGSRRQPRESGSTNAFAAGFESESSSPRRQIQAEDPGTPTGRMGSMTRMRLGLVVTQMTRLASVVAPLSTTGAQAPPRTLDEGTFLVSRSGAPTGRESFRISQARGAAEAYRATAQVVIGDRRIVPTLTC